MTRKILLILAVVLALPWFVSAKENKCACEVKFKKSYPIVWRAKVIASFVSGTDFGLTRLNGDKFYLMANGKVNSEIGDNIKIEGRMIGLTCAYQNVFQSKTGCVPEIELIKVLK